VKYVFDLGMDCSWVNLGLILLCVVWLRLMFLVVQTSTLNVLGNAFLFQFFELVLLDYLIIVIELFHGFVFVLLHFEMRLVIRLGFCSYC
jgi:hypothetical protein